LEPSSTKSLWRICVALDNQRKDIVKENSGFTKNMKCKNDTDIKRLNPDFYPKSIVDDEEDFGDLFLLGERWFNPSQLIR
jgi:hypothetical protein